VETRRAYVACDGKVVFVLDLKSRTELANIPISGEPDAIWRNPNRERLYCAIEKLGVLEVIDTKKPVVTESVVTEEGAHTSTFNRKRQRLYAFLPKSCRASVYEKVQY
jgi:DNA-binding beta-propeller fold protein YncE